MDGVNVNVTITVRDAPDFHVYMRASAACRHANDNGIKTTLGLAPNKYAAHIARNLAVAAMPKDATHLLFIDNDVYIQKDAITALLEVPCDIAVGCYAQLTQGGQISPYIAVRHSGKWMTEPWEGILEDVEFAGAGCMLIRREVFEALEFPWWNWPLELKDGKVCETSDDVDFCVRAREAGFTIGAHGGVFCGHEKHIDAAALFVSGWCGPMTIEEQAKRNERPVVA